MSKKDEEGHESKQTKTRKCELDENAMVTDSMRAMNAKSNG